MSAKHTPGPWHVTEEFFIHAPGKEWSQAICRTDNVPDMRKEQKKANARLIAAAPEFFEKAERALDNAVETIENIDAKYPKHETTPEWICDIRDAMVRTRDDAESVLTKATEGT